MKKILLSIVMVSFLTACATDPYTGEQTKKRRRNTVQTKTKDRLMFVL